MHINDRSGYGRWKGDTAVSGASSQALMILQERTLGITILEKLLRRASADMAGAVIRRLGGLPQRMRGSIAFNIGQENRQHTRTQKALDIMTQKKLLPLSGC